MKPSLGQYISVEQHKRNMRDAYLRGNRQEPTDVFLGDPRYKRQGVNERAYDNEVEYEVKDADLLAEMNGVEEPTAAQGIRVNVRRNNQMIDEAQRQFEESKAAAEGQRWKGQERWQGRENEEMRKVNVMHCREFVRILGRHGIRIWLNNFTKLGRIGVNARVLAHDDFGQPIGWLDKTVTTLHYPWGYEWSIMRFNEWNVPTQEKFRGWRTALLAMISQGVLTEQRAHEIFGVPVYNAASEFYREQLWNLRNLRGMFEKPVSVNFDATQMSQHINIPVRRKKTYAAGRFARLNRKGKKK